MFTWALNLVTNYSNILYEMSLPPTSSYKLQGNMQVENI